MGCHDWRLFGEVEPTCLYTRPVEGTPEYRRRGMIVDLGSKLAEGELGTEARFGDAGGGYLGDIGEVGCGECATM